MGCGATTGTATKPHSLRKNYRSKLSKSPVKEEQPVAQIKEKTKNENKKANPHRSSVP